MIIGLSVNQEMYYITTAQNVDQLHLCTYRITAEQNVYQ